jgi:hypothetical protein
MAMNPRLLRPILSGDPDARRYIAAVQAADQQSLEPAVRKAINDFVVGCKADGIWSALKACCLLAGPRTLAGINVPLVGPTPTFNAFTATEYDRKTGLKGDASTMYIDSKRNNNADPQDNQHLAVYASEIPGTNRHYIGNGTTTGGPSMIVTRSSAVGPLRARSRAGTIAIGTGTETAGFLGKSRATSSSFDIRASQTTSSHAQVTVTPTEGNIFVFASNNAGVVQLPVDARLAYYSIGESINLALLDTRVSAYYTAIGAAI